MDSRFQANRKLWDEWAVVHERSDFYDVETFKEGRSTLLRHEVEELGDLSGKAVMHLMCHIGLDTMTLSRMGAVATGIDFSSKSIDVAKELAKETKLATRFVESDVYALGETLPDEKFDLVYTSHGVVMWLPDLEKWARVVADLLLPGGSFYISELHPFSRILTGGGGSPRAALPYFSQGQTIERSGQVSYAEPSAEATEETNYRWMHTLSDVVNALLSVGFVIEFINEWPYSTIMQLDGMKKADDGTWYLPGSSLPFLFSLRCHLP